MYDIIIVGSGPAGLTAALYARRAEKKVLVIEKNTFGGQITHSPRVENYPGFPVASGSELGDRLLGIHLRDLAFDKKGIDVISHDAAVGDGVIDFERVLAAAEAVGCSYYVIEQKTDEPYRDIEKSFKFLESIRTKIENKE